MGVTALMKWWMSLSRAEMLSLGLTAAGVTTAGAIIAPRALVAMQATAPAAITHNGLSEVRLEILHGLHALLASCDALITVREGRGSRGAAVTLWHSDDRERGVVNEDELLVLLHSPLLRTLTAYTSDLEDEDAPGPSLSADALVDESMPENWRLRPGVRGRVIATDITAVAIERGREAGGMATLTLVLHWDGPTPDEPDVGAATVSLPAVHRAGSTRH
ncbi:MAG: hypothetical protein EA376_09050 [Phycisphaeraceae bacterium]|nr:MAG: hypothetical protein EA376_09050 [Phycisphaeraceae bacterium]